jgi:hypothetical protein
MGFGGGGLAFGADTLMALAAFGLDTAPAGFGPVELIDGAVFMSPEQIAEAVAVATLLTEMEES